jgi:surfactin synthase thioesterase subunit
MSAALKASLEQYQQTLVTRLGCAAKLVLGSEAAILSATKLNAWAEDIKIGLFQDATG